MRGDAPLNGLAHLCHQEQEDVTSSTTTDDVSLVVVEELERKAAEVEAQLRRKEEENAALKRRLESYHIRWLEYEIRIKSLEEAFHEQMATLQLQVCSVRISEQEKNMAQRSL
jgi:hypothetical protein